MDIQQNNTIPENLPILQQETSKQGRPKWFWFLVAAVIISAGLLVLRFAGGIFIKEVTQDVIVEERTAEFSEISQLAPYFELENLKGEKIKISDFLGKPAVLTFWTTWNTLSVDQMRIFETLRSDLKGISRSEAIPVEVPRHEPSPDDLGEGQVGLRGGESLFRTITINSQEDRSIVSNFIERGNYGVEVLLDENGAVGEMYKVRTLPVTYFLDKEGNIADIYVGLLDAEAIVDKVGEIISGE
ncbi:MAG: TlpA disulfide reductase family protein [Candidatus Taylorbacteria bacterium]|nr:TlpA disulfide reductase family protein [Candidatus Taylorbacteria bacterium]